MAQFEKTYDLEKRTLEFSNELIVFCKFCPKDIVTTPLISQLIRSGTSIGANYMETNGGSSRKDFQNKISICKKEAQETKHWLRMLLKYFSMKEQEIKKLWNEAHELTLIFQKIVYSTKHNQIKS